MKQTAKTAAAVLIALIMGIAGIAALTYYCIPMENVSYNLSMFAEDGEEYAIDRGWTVFIDSEGDRKELIPDGFGGFSGLSYPGQTFYFSRELTEELDSPAISIGAVNRNFSIFLDDTLVYTDCPEADNRIGYVSLPMLEYDRTESLSVTLPPDCHGKILTIAQSSSALSEKQDDSADTVYPSEVTLYCGYAYESGLISDACKTAIPAAILLAFGIVLLAAFVWNAIHGSFIAVLPVSALAAFWGMCHILANAPFFFKYFSKPYPPDLTTLFLQLSMSTLLLYLALRAVRYRWILLTAAALQTASVLFSVIFQCSVQTVNLQLVVNCVYRFPNWTGFLALLAALAYSVWMAKNDSVFHKYMARAALGLVLCYAASLLLSIPFAPEYAAHAVENIARDITNFSPYYTLDLIWEACLLSSITALITELIGKEIERFSAVAMLTAQNKLAMDSYENLKQQNKEFQMLRHDTAKHYTALRIMLDKTPERIGNYLDVLIGQLQGIRPVVESGNEILDILVNGKLSAAADMGIHLDIMHSQAPKNLPLSDADLCSVILNILDNAINAASVPGIQKPYIKLNMQCKNHYFVFTCENSAARPAGENEHKITPGHGYGLKIINQIMKRYGNMVSVESSDQSFKISVAFLYDQNIAL